MKMENAEEVFHFLEEFSKRKPKTIPQELNEYLAYVARTGDPVYQWPLVKSLFKEKLLNVITDFYETTPGIDIPPYPNVDPFNYDTMKNSLLERLDSFTSAPFTVQRICELLTYPRKQYNRVDKFMRAIEKNILVVSTREPGMQRHVEPENGEPIEPIVNGSDNNSEYNVDVEMEDMSWKANTEQQQQQTSEPQPGSSDAPISVHEIEARLKAKKDAPMDVQDKISTQYESVTPPELNITTDSPTDDTKTPDVSDTPPATSASEEQKPEATTISEANETPKTDIEMKTEDTSSSSQLVIPEIQIDDAEMTEQKLNEQSVTVDVKASEEKEKPVEEEPVINTESKPPIESQPTPIDENSSDSNKEEIEPKLISEVSTSSEESSSSSDITDGNSNSPKTDEAQIDVQEESSQSDTNTDSTDAEVKENPVSTQPTTEAQETSNQVAIQSDNYSISDVNSELPQPPPEPTSKEEEPTPQEEKPSEPSEVEKDNTEQNAESTETPTDSTPT